MPGTEIAPRIHRIACPFGDDRIVYCHLLVGRTRSLLVDTGMSYTPERDLFPYLTSIGHDPATLDYVLISHSDVDHQGGIDLVRAEAADARFMAHTLDVPWIESPEALVQGRYMQFMADHGLGLTEPQQQSTLADCRSNIPMDTWIEGGESIRLGPNWVVQLIHTPGHSWGHTAVYDPSSKTLIAGEAALFTAILGKDNQPALPPTYQYVDAYLSTIDRLLGMDIQTYSSAHWPLLTGNDAKIFLEQSRIFCLHVEDLLLRTLKGTKDVLTLQDLIAKLKPTLGHWPDAEDWNLAFPFSGNLRRLEDRGLIQRTRSANGLIGWSSATG